LKSLGEVKEEEVMISNIIRETDAKIWGDLAELKATESSKIPNNAKCWKNILRKCVTPLLHQLKSDKTEVRKGATDEKEHRLMLKNQGQEMFKQSLFSNASARYLKAARSGDLTITTANVLRNLGMCFSFLGN
jgi:hypothetical protein